MFYGETGVKPLSVDIETRLVAFWSNMVIPSRLKQTTSVYNLILSNYVNSNEQQRVQMDPFS